MAILSDIACFVEDKVRSSDIELSYYITTDCILPNKQGRTIAQNLPPQECSLTRYTKSDVLIANIRPYLKKIWYADCEGGCSNDVLVLRVLPNHSSAFLFAALSNDRFFDYVMMGTKGSKMPRGDKDQIMRYKIPMMMTYNEEESIGRMILSIERKIKTNQEINHNLEAMAKQLYDYWFVQFDFPNADGKPYKSSGGKMMWNKKFNRELPSEWTDGKLIDIATITMGQSPDGSSYNEDGNGTLFYQGSTDFGVRFPSVRQYTTSPSRMANKGDILMSVRAPVGAMNIANNDCCIGRGLSALNSKIGSITHLYYILNDLRVAFEQHNAAGTTFGSITKDDLHNLPVIVPPNDIMEKFEKLCQPMFDIQMKLGEEIEDLIKLREELLPLLMNGQVSVNYDLT